MYRPTSTLTAIPNPIMGMKASVLMLNAMFVAARLTVPRRPTMRTKAANPAMSSMNCIPEGTPYFTSLEKSAPSGLHPDRVE